MILTSKKSMKELNCGDLAIQFTNQFEFAWNDQGSEGSFDGSYYRPIAPSDYYPLGYYGQSNYNQAKGVVIVVKELISGALARPVDYEIVWQDSGSGAGMDVTFWRPIPPNGYVALGLVVIGNYDDKPSFDQVRCVRQDLVVPGVAGKQVWIDKDTGAGSDFGSWEIDAPPITGYEDYAYIAPGTFFGVNSHERPNNNPVLNCLKVVLPFEKRVPTSQPPSLTSLQEPPETTSFELANSVWTPYFAVEDKFYDDEWKIANSPFYLLEREEYYTRQWHYYNNSDSSDSKQVEVKVGISQTDSKTFSQQTGISISSEASAGIEGIASAKISTTFSFQMGFETSSSFTSLKETTITDTYNIPPHKAVALWTKTNRFTLKRANGSIVGNSWAVQTNSTVKDQFPD